MKMTKRIKNLEKYEIALTILHHAIKNCVGKTAAV